MKKDKLKKYAMVFFGADGRSVGISAQTSNWMLIRYTDLVPMKRDDGYNNITYNFKADANIIYRSELNKKELLIKKTTCNHRKAIYATWKYEKSQGKPFRVYLSSEDGDIRFKASSDSEAILYALCKE